MLSRKLVALAVLAIAPAALCAAEPEHPYKKAEKGQWATYKITGRFEGSVKQKVTEKTDKSVSLEATITFNGMDLPPQKRTIDLTKPFDPMTASLLPLGNKAKAEKQESGKETVEAAGKKYQTEWTSYKVSADFMGNKLEGTMKVWLSKDAPVGGIVKTETKMSIMGNDIEGGSILDSSGKD